MPEGFSSLVFFLTGRSKNESSLVQEKHYTLREDKRKPAETLNSRQKAGQSQPFGPKKHPNPSLRPVEGGGGWTSLTTHV